MHSQCDRMIRDDIGTQRSKNDKCGLKNDSGKLSLARQRWNILSKALEKKSLLLNAFEKPAGSIRQFSSFGLIQICANPINQRREIVCDNTFFHPSNNVNKDQDKGWHSCICVDAESFPNNVLLEIYFPIERIPIEELFNGFDNTGNVCLWPSEEILAYYCLKNKELFCGNSVCELGGGQTCLSGLVTAICGAKRVLLTDGNERCISNVKRIIRRNQHRFRNTTAEARPLRWDGVDDNRELNGAFDVVICSDCLYFDEGRQSLVNAISKLLNESGIAIILAPNRGHSYQKFISVAKNIFDVKEFEKYDNVIWEKHQHFLRTSSVYNEDLHYPKMIILRHSKKR